MFVASAFFLLGCGGHCISCH